MALQSGPQVFITHRHLSSQWMHRGSATGGTPTHMSIWHHNPLRISLGALLG